MSKTTDRSEKLIYIFTACIAVAAIVGVLTNKGWINPVKTLTITVIGEDIPSSHALEKVAKDFEKHSGGKISVSFVTDEYGVMVKKANQDLASKTGVYDIILQYNTALANYSRNNYVFRLSDIKEKLPNNLNASGMFEFEDLLFENVWKEVGWYPTGNGISEIVPVGIPFSANTMFISYNKKMFSDPSNKEKFQTRYGFALAAPKTWQQFKDIAEFFTVPGVSNGLALQGAPYWIYYEWANLAFSFGGGVMNKEWGWQGDASTPLSLTSPETIRATEFYRSLKPYTDMSVLFNSDAGAQRERMKKGDVAMCIMWSDVAYDLVVRNTYVDKNWGFAPIPGKKSMLAGGSFYINRRSSHPREAMEFVLFMMTKESQKKLLENGLCSPLITAYEEGDVHEKVPYAKALKESLVRGVYMLEAGSDADAIIQILSNALQSLFRDSSLNTKEVLETASRDIESKRAQIYGILNKK